MALEHETDERPGRCRGTRPGCPMWRYLMKFLWLAFGGLILIVAMAVTGVSMHGGGARKVTANQVSSSLQQQVDAQQSSGLTVHCDDSTVDGNGFGDYACTLAASDPADH